MNTEIPTLTGAAMLESIWETRHSDILDIIINKFTDMQPGFSTETA